ncbi:MAG: 4-(cytidine 5'-diphospho)-2-C-methyl-D-erythritol kinase [Melioribacteraceae bacterium]|nr:4-(cytidine 5'-diphospho)-2-C-methyl-D-erythritol kinase [Melioribacteraceae bacterium]MCF8432544.1 4-(cytidine 5'-diphospho)-2-C-methyl-D-erythritol kinase [Melioribacteraceae bacterium]
MQKIELKSIAKINVGLKVLRKRDDGFHDLQTLFYPVKSLYDDILIAKSKKFQFRTNIAELNTEENLIVKAVKMIESQLNIKFDVEISCKKSIPQGAGLAGGSSNAATVLLGLIKLFDLELPNKRLSKIALELGSDVPYFLNPVPSFGTSRGEVLEQINFPLKGYLLIVNPGIHISTKEAFQNVKKDPSLINYNRLIVDGEFDFNEIKRTVQNDFEEYVFEKYPQIAKIKTDLYEFGARFALMTGTGSTVYGIFDDLLKAEYAASQLNSSFMKLVSNLG